ncbi:MAG TPA: hypothetical protein VG327_19640 [Mycobacterium sp.]|nr:hypothetical protein [Mycobacterium sp.]
MKKLTMLLAGAEIALIATAVLHIAFRHLWITLVGVTGVALALALVGGLIVARHQISDERTIGVGPVCTVGSGESATADGERQIFIEVVAVSGETFIGKLARCEDDPDASMLRPGLVVLVAFDPAAREELSLPDDVLAVHASWFASV